MVSAPHPTRSRGVASACTTFSTGACKAGALVGWARQHYWGVTYHTRRVLSAWVTRIPYEMTDERDREHRRGGARHAIEDGLGHLHWLFEFTTRARRPRRGDHRRNTQRGGDRAQRELPLQPRASAALVRAHVRGHPRHREPDPARVHPGGRRVQAPLRRHPLNPTTTRFHTIHITSTRSTVATSASSPSATSTPRTSDVRRGPRTSPAPSSTRRCWDATDGATW